MGVDTRIAKSSLHNGAEITLRYFGADRNNRGWSYRIAVDGRTTYCAWINLRFFGEAEDEALANAQWLADRMKENPALPVSDKLLEFSVGQ